MNYKMQDLVPIVAEIARKYAGSDSTSITYEKAQMLMAGVIYCLNEYNKTVENGLVDNSISVKEQYNIGAGLVVEKANEVRKIYNEMSSYFDDYGVTYLHDTVIKGIPEFMKWYDAEFCPQDTILTLDYPLLMDIHSLNGVDAVHKYLSAVRIEQLFLREFDREYVISVLRTAVPGYEQMLENVCGIMLMNIVGHAAIAKPLDDYRFNAAEYEELMRIFSSKPIDEIADLVRHIIEEMTNQLHDNSGETLDYLCCDVNNMAVRIDVAAEIKQLDKIFLI